MSEDYSLSDDQIEVLQEFMNVAYGSATAIIAEILDAFATLDIPRVHVLTTAEFETYLKDIIKQDGECFFCSQGINGDLSGESILAVSAINLTPQKTMTSHSASLA